MKRLVKTIAALACVGVFASGANAADYTIKLAHNGPEQHPFQNGALKFKEILEAKTNGAVEVQIFPAEQLGSEEETSQMVKQGTLACAVESAGGGLAPFVPEADLFNLPFIFSDIDHFYRVVDGPIGDQIAGKVEDKLNSVFMGWWFSGVRNAWNGKLPVMKPEDLEGLKIRVMGSPVLIDTFNALGAQATPMSFGEVYTSLQQGVIDGAESDHVDLLVEKFYEVTKHVSLTGHMYLAAGLICGQKAFGKLPEDIQIAVRTAGAEATKAERNAMRDMTEDALAQLKEKGIKFHNVDVELFRAKVKSVYTKNANKVGGMKLIEAVTAQ
jgi:tripartite ATP-independent transporter DctP family solute receptor